MTAYIECSCYNLVSNKLANLYLSQQLFISQSKQKGLIDLIVNVTVQMQNQQRN